MSKNIFKTFSDEKIPAVMWSSALIPILDEGHTIKIPLSGRSMFPLLVGGRDEVILISVANKRLKRGDITLYVRDDGTHVLHRIHHFNGDEFYMLGDAQTWIEGPIKRERILAIVDSVIRKGKKITCASFYYRTLSAAWLLLRPVRPLITRFAVTIYAFIQRIRRNRKGLE